MTDVNFLYFYYDNDTNDVWQGKRIGRLKKNIRFDFRTTFKYNYGCYSDYSDKFQEFYL